MTHKNALVPVDGHEGEIVLGKPETLLPINGSDEEIAGYAQEQVGLRLVYAKELLERGADMLVEAGAYLTAIKKRLGGAGVNAVCKNLGLSQKTAYNYMNLYKFRDNQFLRRLEPTRAYTAMRLLTDPGVKFEDDAIVVEDGDSTVRVTLDETKAMTMLQLTGIVEAIKSRDRKLAACLAYEVKQEEKIAKKSQTIADLEKKIKEITGNADIDPTTKKLQDIQKGLFAVGREWVKVLDVDEADLDENQLGIITSIDEYLHTLAVAKARRDEDLNGL